MSLPFWYWSASCVTSRENLIPLNQDPRKLVNSNSPSLVYVNIVFAIIQPSPSPARPRTITLSEAYLHGRFKNDQSMKTVG